MAKRNNTRYKGKFYNFNFDEQKNETDLYLYGEIVSSADWKWEEEDVCFQDFKDVIDDMQDSTTLNIHVNSPGGSVFASSAIVSLLKSTKARGITINSFIDSLGASCASWIPLVADNVYIYKNSILMLHRPMTSCQCANADEMEKQIELLNKIEDSVMLPLYMDKVKEGITEDYIKDLLKKESWLTYDQILDIFDVTLIEENQQEYVACVDKDVMKNYINIPDNIRDLLEKEGNSLKVDNKTEEHDAIDHEAEVEETVEEVTETEEEIEAEVEEVTEDNAEVEDNSESEVEQENEVETYEAEPEPGAEEEVDHDVAEEEEHLQKKLNASNEKVIILNDKVQELENKIKELEEIENKYNELKDKMEQLEVKDKVEEKFAFYKDKFAKFDALDKFKSDEVQNLIKDCVTNEKSLSKLNQMVVEMIDIDKHSRIVKPSISESSDKLEDLIPNQESGLSSLFE